MIRQLLIYKSSSFDPYENLAAEKLLLDCVPGDCCILYLWQNQSTVVIGRNQNPWAECRCSLLEAEDGKLARRLSGGGAVFHDLGNLNFTFLCSAENYDLDRQLQVIRAACRLAGISTTLSGRNDILAEGRKFSGNAFYNSKGKSYHHGTLLVSADMERLQRYLTPPKAKLEAKGVKSVRSRVVNLQELAPGLTCETMAEYMAEAFSSVYGIAAANCPAPDPETVQALAKTYGSWEYLYGTPLPFTFSCEDHFSWGHVQLQLQARDGSIQSAVLYTDAMDWQLPEAVSASLTGCRLDLAAMKAALEKGVSQPAAGDLISLLQQQVL